MKSIAVPAISFGAISFGALSFGAMSLAAFGTATAAAAGSLADPPMMSGPVASAPAMDDQPIRIEGNRMTTALNLLEARGYGSFSGFEADGPDYRATVTQDGHRFQVRIDPIERSVSRLG